MKNQILQLLIIFLKQLQKENLTILCGREYFLFTFKCREFFFAYSSRYIMKGGN